MTPIDELPARQREALELMCEGLTAKEIGIRMGIKRDTVKNHLTAAYRALGVQGNIAACRLLWEATRRTEDAA